MDQGKSCGQDQDESHRLPGENRSGKCIHFRGYFYGNPLLWRCFAVATFPEDRLLFLCALLGSWPRFPCNCCFNFPLSYVVSRFSWLLFGCSAFHKFPIWSGRDFVFFSLFPAAACIFNLIFLVGFSPHCAICCSVRFFHHQSLAVTDIRH